MIVQAPNCNRGPWKFFEAHRRTLAEHGKELFVVAGPAGRGGQGERGWRVKLGDYDNLLKDPHVDVPSCCWAACLILDDRTGDDLQRVTKDTAAIAVIMPNVQSLSQTWTDFETSIDEIESLTDLDLFDLVDPAAQRSIERRE